MAACYGTTRGVALVPSQAAPAESSQSQAFTSVQPFTFLQTLTDHASSQPQPFTDHAFSQPLLGRGKAMGLARLLRRGWAVGLPRLKLYHADLAVSELQILALECSEGICSVCACACACACANCESMRTTKPAPECLEGICSVWCGCVSHGLVADVWR